VELLVLLENASLLNRFIREIVCTVKAKGPLHIPKKLRHMASEMRRKKLTKYLCEKIGRFTGDTRSRKT
jgi:hypothetical protein